MVTNVKLGESTVGDGQPCFVIAEAGVNHNGNLALARQLVDAAADAGAHAVKFQTFRTEKLVTIDAPKAEYQRRTSGANESQFEMLKKLELSRDSHLALIDYCKQRGILFLSSPFEEESADELVSLGLAAIKIPSGELTNLPFLKHVACKKVAVILSTGMSSIEEVDQAVQIFRQTGNSQLVLLHCVSSYPADAADCNLRAMESMRKAFGVPVGFSDHTEGIECALAAVALGACVVEKHFTLDRTLPGPDHQASLEPNQLAELIRGIHKVEAALGDGVKLPSISERDTAAVARKSIVANREIPRDCTIEPQMLALRRPGTGLPPAALRHVTGRKARQTIPAGALISWEMLT